MQRIALAAVFSSFLLLSGCLTDDAPDRSISGNAYSNKAIGLKLAFPADWTIKTDQVYGNYKFDIIALGPMVDAFSPNMNLLYGAHGGPSNMDSVLSMVAGQLQAGVADLSAYQQAILTVDGKEVGKVEYESTSNGVKMRFRLLLFMNKGKDVTLTFTDKAERFSANADFQSITASMSISP